jgi:putative tryptophan/tyrosine transport system substrate-binding protein
MDRRAFVTGLGTLLAAPVAAKAQQAPKVYRVGVLASFPMAPFFRDPFVATLRDLGYVEGQNLMLEIRSANNLAERLPALAAELVRLNVDVIVTGGDSEVIAAKQATTTIPIVMAPSGDPVRAGFVKSFARPGGNITGVSFVTPDLSPKLLEVLRDAVPDLSRIVVLWNAANSVKVIDFDETRRAAQALRLTVSSIEIKVLSELETAFSAITRARPDGLVILVDQLLSPLITPRIAQFAMQRRIPSIAGTTSYAVGGGLIGYGPTGIFQIAAGQVARILKGASPANLPVAQPTRLELTLNLKTAKALGLTIPQSLLLRADHVIE